SRADWLVGMNLSRAYSLTLDQDISVGRVQTPTLAIVADREVAIRSFVPEDYLEVVATFAPVGSDGKTSNISYEGTWFRPPALDNKGNDKDEDDPAKRKRLPPDGEDAAAIVARALSGKAAILSVEAETRKLPPPLLYDLTELQRHANRLFGLSAQKTLDIAQALYERHKLLSYPRTDSRHLSKDAATTLGAVVKAIAGRYPGLIAPGSGTKPLGRRFVDDARVTDHHAIIPTATPAREGALGADEQRIYDMVCRRILEAWHEDHVYSVTTVITGITSLGRPPILDQYESRGTAVDHVGWKVLDFGGGKKAPRPTRKGDKNDQSEAADEPDNSDQALPAGLTRGQPQKVLEAVPVPKRTRPPPRYTEATLLTAMEHAGRTLEEKELSDAMKDLGLGTPATRAQIIETLLRREYVIRQGKSLEATDKGIGLVSVVHPEVKSPAMTGEWEAKLKRMQRGQGDLPAFMASIEAYVTDVVSRVAGGKRPPPSHIPHTTTPQAMSATATERPAPRAPKTTASERVAAQINRTTTLKEPGAIRPATSSPARNAPSRSPSSPITTAATSAPRAQRAPTAPENLRGLLQTAFGFDDFRPYQETVCRTATQGRDLLLVMPTGAGKSLCYQLPGVARAGTTLVVSPLIALMEDQATKLTAQGFRAERIHSGRSRADSRQACIDYLAGRLDFLFIAPERLRVPGFPEMLAKRIPALIAVDEAHCISQWGHDFRPDYRMLGQRLPLLRPAPIIALTATATPQVQDDIAAQLGLDHAARFIHGFRRTNIAIEIVERSPGERADVICEILADKARRPAIVYAATRKNAEELGNALGNRLAATYHAGMDADDRDRIQTAFLDGRLEIIVATVAFGMGIDKADVRTIIHAALPGSLEGYYQEIGRAGRDGKPSSAILLHSFVDRKTHEFFHDRDYPEPAVLESIYAKLSKKPVDRDKLRAKLHMDPDKFDKALEKLGIHGGVETTQEGEIIKGNDTWKRPYLVQRDHKLEQLQVMGRFAESHGCRMVHMIRHFGDQEDSGAPCGLCDVCAPNDCIARRFREPSRAEETAIARILEALARDDEQATGRLHRETFPDGGLDRRAFEHILGGLTRAGLVILSEDSFEKDGKEITYQRATLTYEGRERGRDGAGIALTVEPTKKAKAKRGASSSASSASSKKSDAKSKWFFINRNKRAKKTSR
ncbi:MAG: RecQ family ATP-dependent DNA helicase, partial [Byssovorax sp.]